jgi:hypothetical protein
MQEKQLDLEITADIPLAVQHRALTADTLRCSQNVADSDRRFGAARLAWLSEISFGAVAHEWLILN